MRLRHIISSLVVGLFAVATVYFFINPEELTKLHNALIHNTFLERLAMVTNSAPGPLRFLGGDVGGELDTAAIISETNKRRTDNKQPLLTENTLLNRAAEMKLKDMAEKQYFEHVSPSGKGPSDLAKEAGYSYVVVGENLAMGNFKDDSALLDAWMNSPGHRANILNSRYKEIGVAAAKVTYEGRSTWLAVQEFGKPESDCTPTNAALKERIAAEQSALQADEAELSRRKKDLDSRNPQTAAERRSYNQDVESYNALLESYKAKAARLQSDIAEYNVQVRAYNQCISS